MAGSQEKGDKVVSRFEILENRQNLDFGFEILVLDLRFERRMSRENKRVSGSRERGTKWFRDFG